MQHYKNINVRLLLAPIPIKYLLEGPQFLRSLIDPSIYVCVRVNWSPDANSVTKLCDGGVPILN